jgi:hypothetical protein
MVRPARMRCSRAICSDSLASASARHDPLSLKSSRYANTVEEIKERGTCARCCTLA